MTCTIIRGRRRSTQDEEELVAQLTVSPWLLLLALA
jgi:hypothetical protein